MFYTMFMEHATKPGQAELKKERVLLMITIILSYLIDFIWIGKYHGMNYGLSMFISYIELLTKIPAALISIIKFMELTGKNFGELKEEIPS